MINSVTKEGINKMEKLFGRATSFWKIDIHSLEQLYINMAKKFSLAWGLAAVYEMGRIDGIRQERARIKSVKSQKIDQEPIENNSIELTKITIGTRTFVEVRKELQAI